MNTITQLKMNMQDYTNNEPTHVENTDKNEVNELLQTIQKSQNENQKLK